MKRLLPLRVMLPLALGVIVSLGVLGFAEIGYRRLEFANKAMSAALEMETAVNETLALIGAAEAGQRGYLLTGEPSYLKPYKAALPKIDQTFGHLRELVNANGTAVMIDHAGQLNVLIGKKLNELESTLALNDRSGREAALQLINTGLSQRLTDELRTQAQAILDELRVSSRRGGARWAQDIEFGRVGMLTMTAFTIALLFVVWALARREISAREAKRADRGATKARAGSRGTHRGVVGAIDVPADRARRGEIAACARHSRRARRHSRRRENGCRVGGATLQGRAAGGSREAQPRAHDPRRRRRDEAADHRGAAADAARQPGHLVGDRLAGTPDMRARRPALRIESRRPRVATRSVDHALSHRAGGADEHRQVRERAQCRRRTAGRCRRRIADRARRRRRLAGGRRIEPPFARHRRHAPARARARWHVQDRQSAGHRYDHRSLHPVARSIDAGAARFGGGACRAAVAARERAATRDIKNGRSLLRPLPLEVRFAHVDDHVLP